MVLPEAAAQSDLPYPEISKLEKSDVLFSQLEQDVSEFRIAFAGGKDLPPLLFYRYTIKQGEDLYTVAAGTNLGIATLSTLNGIDNPTDTETGRMLAIPNMPGLFVPTQPRNDLERIMVAIRSSELKHGIPAEVRVPEKRKFVFLPDANFLPMERAYYLKILFRYPIREGEITSNFGERMHPVSGAVSFHSGIDIAAPSGTEVIAAGSGTIAATGWDDDLGNYIIMNHGGVFTTIYGHLSAIAVNLNQRVNSGSLLGKVGSTGLSTGPHLHFEVRSDGVLRDPIPLIRGTIE